MINPPSEVMHTQPVSIKQKKPTLNLLYDDACPFCRRFYEYIVYPLEVNNVVWLVADNVRHHQTEGTSWIRYRKENPPIIRVKLSEQDDYNVAFGWGANESLARVRNKIYNYIGKDNRIPKQLYMDIPDFEENDIIEREKQMRQTGEVYES